MECRRGCQDGAVPSELTSFPPEVAQKLKTYVYRLIDPRNGETFYVGKGHGNRVFADIREQVGDDDPNLKLKRIRDNRLAGFEAAHVIHATRLRPGVHDGGSSRRRPSERSSSASARSARVTNPIT